MLYTYIWCSKIIKLNIINILTKVVGQKRTFDSDIDLTLSKRAKIIWSSISFLGNPAETRKR